MFVGSFWYPIEKDVFTAVLRDVEGACASPDQRDKADKIWRMYMGELQAVPKLPAIPGAGPSQSSLDTQVTSNNQAAQSNSFRPRGTSCLFTYNSSQFGVNLVNTWVRFMLWLESLDFIFRWSATMEEHLGRNYIDTLFFEFSIIRDYLLFVLVEADSFQVHSIQRLWQGALTRFCRIHHSDGLVWAK
jgi:hypothetical protein